MMASLEKIKKFELKHKILVFIGAIIITILSTRFLSIFYDPDIFIGVYEIHHFYYGVIILIITTLFMLFDKKHYLIYLVTSAIGIGLILDEFLFIMGGIENSAYPSTFVHSIPLVFVVIIMVFLIKKYKP